MVGSRDGSRKSRSAHSPAGTCCSCQLLTTSWSTPPSSHDVPRSSDARKDAGVARHFSLDHNERAFVSSLLATSAARLRGVARRAPCRRTRSSPPWLSFPFLGGPVNLSCWAEFRVQSLGYTGKELVYKGEYYTKSRGVRCGGKRSFQVKAKATDRGGARGESDTRDARRGGPNHMRGASTLERGHVHLGGTLVKRGRVS